MPVILKTALDDIEEVIQITGDAEMPPAVAPWRRAAGRQFVPVTFKRIDPGPTPGLELLGRWEPQLPECHFLDSSR